MATADSIKKKLQVLIDNANQTTGESDTTLINAVNRLREGFGKGAVTQRLSVTENGSYTPPDEVDGFDQVEVNVDTQTPYNEGYEAGRASIVLQDKTVSENGTVYPDNGFDGLSSVTVDVPTSGGESIQSSKWNDVTFIDYDGSVLYSYSLAEAQALTELPSLPTHNGLICQGWNWTLEAIKSLNRPVTVGAMYITDDGATRLHIRIATAGRMNVPLYIGQTVANGVSIDWGDGSVAETLASTGYVNTSHTYAEPGYYVISLMPEDGCTLSFGSNSSSYCVMGSTGDNGKVYCNVLQEVSIGKNVTSIDYSAFNSCYSLASVTIPNSVTSIRDNAFYYCYSLASITIPDGVTSIGDRVFGNCCSLASITIPDGVTSIGSSAFSNCCSLASVTIPNSVTSIGSSAFNSCYSLASVTIPNSVTSIGSSAFNGCYSLASVTIPNSVTSIRDNAFSNCCSLASVTIPDGVTSIGYYVFRGCYSLSSITIPNSVTSIGDSAFNYCYGMRFYDFSNCTHIPTLSNTSTFNNIPSDCQMLIPTVLYDEWSTATNWVTYAKYMVAV